MIIVGTVLGLACFLFIGWVISTEMFQQRSWRRRVASGDHMIVEALILEAMAAWRRARPPRDVPASLWAGVQRAELATATTSLAVVQSSAEGEFRSVDGHREQVSSAIDEAFALAARLVEMMLYDVPNLSLGSVRVDVYSTFTADGGAALQKPILTTTACRPEAEGIDWEELAPVEILSRFETIVHVSEDGLATPIVLPPIPSPSLASERDLEGI
ncbi:MAG: hypothetical protein CL897_06905 [Dehalococcoidia bacterium]|nr:hypothetical protein [Dehalococcoidia bacterium]|tara:strand:- start:2527 stop:3171 length:645 start_codon:yes stop_codon:yes gene_type:complete